MAGFIEQWGRGYEKIHDAFEREHLLQPIFEQARGGILVTIRREKFVTIQNGKFVDTEGATTDVPDVVDKLTERQCVIMNIIRRFVVDHVVDGVVDSDVEVISARSIAKQLHMSSRTIQRELAFLQSKGLIEHVGKDNNGHWEIIDKSTK